MLPASRYSGWMAAAMVSKLCSGMSIGMKKVGAHAHFNLIDSTIPASLQEKQKRKIIDEVVIGSKRGHSSINRCIHF